jgi:hypothetical protein
MAHKQSFEQYFFVLDRPSITGISVWQTIQFCIVTPLQLLTPQAVSAALGYKGTLSAMFYLTLATRFYS